MERGLHEASSTLSAQGALSGSNGWDDTIGEKVSERSHEDNADSLNIPFSTPTEKALVNTNGNDDLESGQETSSIQEEASEDANIVSWDGEADPDNPMNWPSWRRWVLINLVGLITLMAGLSSSMFAPGVPALMVEFHSDNSTLASFVVTVFVLGFATGPLLFAPLSELYGRTIVQHTGCIGFVIFSIACALSTTPNMLIGMRLLQGIFAAVPLTNGGAIVADMVKQEQRGFAMAMLTLGVLMGPVIGPVTGGFLAAAKGWRWVFWLIAIVMGFLAILCFVFWKESYAPIILARKAARLRKETGNQALRSKYDIGLSPRAHLKRGIGRAVKMLLFSPIVLALSVYMGLIYSYFYLLFTTFTPIFEQNYHFPPDTVGLSYLGVGVGFIVGQASFAKLGDPVLKKCAARFGKGELKPEYRLPLCCIGALFIPIALFWYGWSVVGHVHWIVPIIGTGFLGLGNALIFVLLSSLLRILHA